MGTVYGKLIDGFTGKGGYMSGMENGMNTVTIKVNRFTPRPDRGRERSGSPFAKKSSPFGDSGASARRRSRGKQWVQEYTLNVRPEDTVLDCLLKIKQTIDPTLAFRYSCGHGICGSDAVSVNGTPTLLCSATVKDWAKRPINVAVDDEGFRHTGAVEEPSNESPADDTNLGVIELAALPGFPVLRDLIADIDQMLDQIKKLKPYLQAGGDLHTTEDGKIDAFEYLQNPQQLAKYELLSNCIACGTCEGSCPVYAGGEAFLGPAALIATSRFINDSRDTQTDARMDAIDSADGIAACQSVRACTRECPRGIDVGEEIWQLIAQVKER